MDLCSPGLCGARSSCFTFRAIQRCAWNLEVGLHSLPSAKAASLCKWELHDSLHMSS